MKLLVLFGFLAAAAAQSSKPNLVFILADDLGWNDVGWHDDKVLTPNLEKLRASGIELDNNYVQPVCTPSRHALMTGMYPFHSGMQSGVVFPDRKECSPLDQRFVAQDLKELGYDTHMIGKWHLGFCDVKCVPTSRGFDSFFGFYNGYIDHYSHMHGETGVSGYDFNNNTVPSPSNAGVHTTDTIYDRSAEIIEFHDVNNPLYMYVAFGAVHSPFQVPKEYSDMYSHVENVDRREYLGMVTHMDAAVGKIVDRLTEKGMMDNTILFFISDNGGEAPTASNAPFRGAKGSFFEGGIKSTGLVYSPLLKGGYKADQMIHVTDWLPTMVSLAGGTPRAGLDGKDQSTFLLNGGGPSAREEFVINIDDAFPQTLGAQGIRSGNYKLLRGYPGMTDGYGDMIMPYYIRCGWDLYGPVGPVTMSDPESAGRHRRGSYTMTEEQIKMQNDCVKSQAPVVRLYDIAADPLETTNLAQSLPDVAAELVAKLDNHILSLRPAPSFIFVPVEQSNPKYYGGYWSPGWCQM